MRRAVQYTDRDSHGESVESDVANIVIRHADRPQTLGVDPRLIVVFELNKSIDVAHVAAADLMVLDSSASDTVIAFSSDPEMAAFLERVAAYRRGIPEEEGRTGASYEQLMDAIDTIRPYGPDDRISERLDRALSEGRSEPLTVDVECWYPSTEDEAEEWLTLVASAVGNASGIVVDQYRNAEAGLALLRAVLDVEGVRQLAHLDVIAHLDLTPTPPDDFDVGPEISADQLPQLTNPAADAPIVGLIDSGVRSAHPLIANAIVEAVTVAKDIEDGEDRHGHGTAVASRLLYGDIRELLSLPVPPPPSCRIVSVRVLDNNNQFARSSLWAREIEDSIRYCAGRGARIINLAIGDEATPYRGPRSTPIAALLDQLARELKLVIVVPTGNVEIVAYSTIDDDLPERYADDLARRYAAAMLDPAPAATALTVGATVNAARPLPVSQRSLGHERWPAPFSRRGPGIERAIKPEVSAPGGGLAYDRANRRLVQTELLDCLVADGSGIGRLLRTVHGTSYAVPLVSRIAAAIAAEYPEFGPEMIRALVLQACDDPGSGFLSDPASDAERRRAARTLIGYGIPNLRNARFSTPHRAVMVAEDEILGDEVHLYRVPIPSSFFESGGSRGAVVSLCFSPPTRSRRLDYLGRRMRFELVRGLTADEVIELFIDLPDDDLPDDEGASEVEESTFSDEDEADDRVSVGIVDNLRLSDLPRRVRPLRSPSGTDRSRGANQLARAVFRQRLKPEHGEDFILIVQSVSRWADDRAPMPYAAAISLWRSENQPEIYIELQQELRAEVELEVELGPH